MLGSQQENQRRSVWEVPDSTPMVSELMPVSRSTSSMQAPYGYDDRQMQSYRPILQQAWEPNVPQSNSYATVKTNSVNNCTRKMLVMGILIGVVICGVPLGVLTTLYIQGKTGNSSGSSNSGSSSDTNNTNSVTLPSQCSSYTNNTDSTRNAGYYCGSCYCDNGLATGWYRFTGSAGTQLVTSPISTGYCGTNYPGWFNGTLPTTVGGLSSGFLCINYVGTVCYFPYSLDSIIVTNCSGFYVFYLRATPYCYSRYCTT
ncbi:unnamed protein product [Rotaria magnacalcarata]|uniref:UMOD/GP2/OIT3-like D8C domain-containing protein n=1 Tax=Rotaria magnacalcarata TaxID=392030 RepID=A0A819E9F7_9BILA|nr:unnamed protein product [Rotaria magnacalcarata]CAF1430822.1 unnamed protein product [Rotaria magnacalcarata]CAF2051854.1 unnamed protein product [Rotaria magnacalcarata]CAF2088789.1 unnamed protein product [Rotaria magnacalcarata]CAF2103379.1 unnamed protein product [Rotaria magnacalcarata]